MSIVVAVSKSGSTVVAADTLTCFGDQERMPPSNSASRKVARVGQTVIGGTGWAVYDDMLNDFLHEKPPPAFASEREIFSFFMEFWKALHNDYSFVNDQSQGKDTPFGDLDSSFLIVNRTGIYKVSSDMGVTRFKQYFAIGSGSEYALGALYNLYDHEPDAASIARRAVETAMQFDVHCGGEIDVLAVE